MLPLARRVTMLGTTLVALLAGAALSAAYGDNDGGRIAEQNDAAATSAAATTDRAGRTPDVAGTPADAMAEPDDGDPDETSVFDLREGDCITSSFGGDETTLEEQTGVVPCDDPRAASEVLALVNVPDADEYPGEAYFDDQTVTRCPEGTDSFYFPTEESWGAGDRTIICLRSLE